MIVLQIESLPNPSDNWYKGRRLTRDPSDTQASWRRKKTRVVVAADKEIEKVIRQLLRTKLEEILVQAVLTGGSVEAK